MSAASRGARPHVAPACWHTSSARACAGPPHARASPRATCCRSPYYNFWMIVEILASIIFVTDMVLKFFVALKEESVYITDHKIIAIRNLK